MDIYLTCLFCIKNFEAAELLCCKYTGALSEVWLLPFRQLEQNTFKFNLPFVV
jgi:hypothetical protein